MRAAGARVLSIGMLQGEVPVSDDFECGLGDEIDEDGDPPRMWLPHAGFPGCAFSRSFGDACAEAIGCFAEPEVDALALGAADRVVVVASDGAWESSSRARRG